MPKLRKTPEEKDAASFRYWVQGMLKDRRETHEQLGDVLGVSGREIGRKLSGMNQFTVEQAIAVIYHFGEVYQFGGSK